MDAKGTGLFVALVAVVVVLAGVAGFVIPQLAPAPSTGCIVVVNAVDQARFGSLIAYVKTDPSFLSFASGQCFDVEYAGYLNGNPSFELVHFTPHVWYPCTTFGVHWIDQVLEVVANYEANGSFNRVNITALGPSNVYHCPSVHLPVYPLTLQAHNGTTENVQITLQGSFGQSFTGLSVTLLLTTGNFTAAFPPAGSSNANQFTSSVDVPPGSMRTWTSYKMVERATLAAGTTFNATVYVQLEG